MKRIIKITVLTLLVYFVFTISASAQAPACPENLVCITREAALKALADGDRVKALEAESKVKDQAVVDLKQLLADMRVNYAEAKGENNILKQDKVEWMAEKELLLKLVRPKKFGVIVF